MSVAELQLLPIDPHLPGLIRDLLATGKLVLQAEPGAGKTTRVAPWLLAQLLRQAGDQPQRIALVQPRRMAAILTARRMADEWPLLAKAATGNPQTELAQLQPIGHRVRFDDQTTAQTRLTVMTDGILLRQLASDPQLQGVRCVVLDEFHERRAAMDVALAALRRLQQTSRPDLLLLVMSATLDGGPIARWLGDAPLVEVTGRTYPVTTEHAETLDERPLAEQVRLAVHKALDRTKTGNVLVFLPGAREIRFAAERLGPALQAQGIGVSQLHGSLPITEQERAIARRPGRQVILSTNIAETSVTLPDIAVVIDSGLSRQAGHAAWSGLTTLQLGRVSKASAIQRAGRAGRTGPGLCLRLFTAWDMEGRPAFDRPELQRSDLSEWLLLLADSVRPLGEMPEADFWLDPPEIAAWRQARLLLQRLGALDNVGRLTAIGSQMRKLALPPRLARLCVEALARGVPELGATVAALLEEADLPPPAPGLAQGESDVWALWQAWQSPDRQRMMPASQRTVEQSIRQIRAQLQRLGVPGRAGDVYTDLGLCLLAAFPDRLARRRNAHQPELDMANSSSVKMGPQSQATQATLLLVLDAEERRDGKLAQTQVRLAHGIDPTLLLETFAADLQETATWELRGDRVVQRQQTTLFGLVIEEQERTAPPGPQTAAVLVPALLKQGGGQVPDAEAWTQLRERLAFAAAHGAPLPVLDDAHMEAMLLQACQTLSRLSEAKSLDLPGVVRASLAGEAQGQGLALLERYAPEHMTLPGGRKLRIHYEADKPPWTSSRLQDFFGLAHGPRVADGKVPVVLHLLAPNQRPVQLTSDLAGFWQRHYPAVRKELMRKYPRHLWPDNPLDAAPPPPNRPR